MRRVPAKDTHVTLRELHMYTRYQVTLLAFNAAGDGPNISVPLEARTSEGGTSRDICSVIPIVYTRFKLYHVISPQLITQHVSTKAGHFFT